MKTKISDLKMEISTLGDEARNLRCENHKLKEGYNELTKTYEEQLVKENQFLKGLVLHLTSKPLMKTDDGKGNIELIQSWKEAGINQVDFYNRFPK
jgi:regulator of replication initiation timing